MIECAFELSSGRFLREIGLVNIILYSSIVKKQQQSA